LEPKKTAFYNIHEKLGAKLINFGGFMMPVQYSSIIEEHKLVRNSVGVFDVSHMGEIEVWGDKALEFVQKITVNDASKLSINQVQYSAMCYDDGGIVDDLLVYRFSDHFMLVVNASNIQKDFEWMLKNTISDVQLGNRSDEISLLAVQGKNAESTLQKLTKINLSEIKYYWFKEDFLDDVPVIFSRTGYTGEPGFEIYFDYDHSEKVWNLIMESGKEFGIGPVGLGARDTLRLEKKFCLYGNDIDQTTNPLEAGLGWITKLDKGDFIGRSALLKVKSEGLKRKLIGFEVEGKNVPRHGYEIKKDNEKIGTVTSGMFSPILDKCIGLGYIKTEFSEVGSIFDIDIRGKLVKAKVVKTPFV
jgi:aminomethyltransferase